MKLAPVIRCSNMQQSLDFYTGILGFTIFAPGTTADQSIVTIMNEDAEIVLCTFDGTRGIILNVDVAEVDLLFEKFLARGLDISGKKNSPVHQGPLNQTWGMREFYVTDHDGNTLRYGRPIE